ncbi:lipoate--protein ligase [Lactobacillus sp. 3B(2020)]|uniref:lipoate--protein ligase n=1 Tax=Lactobacillus sp. 3B(2020) TaxID=2695882 RepID=UPI0015DD75D6|nr:lipoate--protein ligase [Lactobacillus sp. 3B(2020)]QLL69939.1 lipoate--protein ligase [Lactobacillus sp. 3B(2020)]
MQYLSMTSNDIRRNLATEQHLMNSDHMQVPFMLFYIEDSCIIVGRNQNTLEEINQKYCEEHGVTITRRLSGGGAMYQDMGNLCFSFVVPSNQIKFGDFKDLVKPVVDALHDMGATGAEVTGRNDIVIEGKKFSGNAMYSRDGKTFSHGTLMYNVNTEVVADALRVPKDKIESKGIKSVRSRVTNIMPYLKPEFQNLTTQQFRDELIKRIMKVDTIEEAQKNEYHLTDEDNKAIDAIENKWYKNDDWVYGKSPNFTVKKRKHFDGGTIDARFMVEHGKITNLKIYGDFFGPGDVRKLEETLTGVDYRPAAMQEVLQGVDLNKYFVGIPREEVVDLLTEQH